MEDNKSLFDDLKVDFQTGAEVTEMSRWIKMLGIMLLVIPGLVLLMFLVGWNKMAVLFSEGLDAAGEGGTIAVTMILLVAIVVAAILGLIAFFLIRGGKRLYTGIRTRDQVMFNSGLGDVKSFFIIYGVLGLLGLLLNLISLIQ
ncbi:MAG TPA: hypothetical protein PKC69_06280 [Chitinophagaceae bacterium]|nr:hypothetical protein [Chitinophagaceae bacterium]